MKGIMYVQSLKAYHGPSCSFLLESVIVGMVLFQWKYQILCHAIGFSFQLSSVNFGASSLGNKEQLVSPGCHFLHVKGVAVFCKSACLLCSNAFMAVSPHVLVTVNDSFQLSLHPETAIA